MTDTNPLRSFREPNVRIFFGGLSISAVGTWAQLTAVILLVRELGGGGLELGIVTACQFLPTLVLGLYAGAVADRSDRHRLTIVVQSLMGVQALCLGVIVLAGAATIPIVCILSLAFGTLAAFDGPTRRTLATELVPADRMANILALSTSVMTGARVIGPALAAVLVTAIGTGWVFILNGLTFLAFLAAMGSMDTSRFHRLEPSPRSATPVRDGLRAVWAVPDLRIILIVFAVVSTFAYNYLVGFPLLITDRLMEDDGLLGWLLSIMSVGNVVGSLLVARLTYVPQRWMFAAGALVAASLAVIALSTTVAVTFAAAWGFGLASTAFVNSSTILVQQRTDPAMRSRVLALTTVLFLGSTPIGGPITGAVGDLAGAVWATLYGAIIAGVAVLAGAAATHHNRVRSLDAAHR